MELKKLSASSLQAADMCLARFHAQMEAGYGADIKNDYAKFGSSCHGAFQDYVDIVYIKKKIYANLEILLAYFKKHYQIEFKTADLSSHWYTDGIELLTKWYNRTDFSYFEVVSVESKEYFDVQTSIGPIPITYIIDRLDKLDERVYRIEDYKTSNELLSPEGLFKKIQARIYGLALMIKFKEEQLDEVWVEFDMLRFTPVQICLTREDCAETYRMLQRAAERIIAAKIDEENPIEDLETLNPECGFCIRKTNCSAIKKNISVDGVFAYSTLEEMVNARALFEFQRKAASRASEELETLILAEMERENLLEYETDFVDVKLGMSKTRVIDVDAAIQIVGEDTFLQYGGRKQILTGDFDKLVKASPPALAQRLSNEVVSYKYGEPKVGVKMKGDFNT